MNKAVHASSQTLFEALFLVLSQFHSHKENKNVDEALHRLYSPILWRSLSAANPLGIFKNIKMTIFLKILSFLLLFIIVRQNATQIFFDAFPIIVFLLLFVLFLTKY